MNAPLIGSLIILVLTLPGCITLFDDDLPPPPDCGAEVCNGADDDCDGTVDEGDVCAPTCVGDDEVCNGADDDCDGTVDEGDVCAPTCVGDDEVCNGADDDCDGAVDEGEVCAPPCAGGDEVCNGVDDDCDGAVDETAATLCPAPAGGRAMCLDGACALTCDVGRHDLDGAFDNGCEYVCTPSADGGEACDGDDNDCDGIADEGLVGDVVPGLLGVCRGARRVCEGAAGFGEPRYDALPGFEVDEVTCDGRDNDCDGEVDEAQPIGERCVLCDGTMDMPPCNGCPSGVVVPAGLVCIPPGEFSMGSPPEAIDPFEDQRPQQTLLMQAFLMSPTEVTRAEFAALAGFDPSRYRDVPEGYPCHDDGLACPVEGVSWFDAVWFANRASQSEGLTPCYDVDAAEACRSGGAACATRSLQETRCAVVEMPASCDAEIAVRLHDLIDGCTGYRLPWEAEWEYAARAGTTTAYWFGDSLSDADRALRPWCEASRAFPGSGPRGVGQDQANPWGLYDVHGNVSEWTQAVYAPYPDPPVVHRQRISPMPSAGARARRGGAWHEERPSPCGSADRNPSPPEIAWSTTGIRLVRAAPRIADAPAPRVGER